MLCSVRLKIEFSWQGYGLILCSIRAHTGLSTSTRAEQDLQIFRSLGVKFPVQQLCENRPSPKFYSPSPSVSSDYSTLPRPPWQQTQRVEGQASRMRPRLMQPQRLGLPRVSFFPYSTVAACLSLQNLMRIRRDCPVRPSDQALGRQGPGEDSQCERPPH